MSETMSCDVVTATVNLTMFWALFYFAPLNAFMFVLPLHLNITQDVYRNVYRKSRLEEFGVNSQRRHRNRNSQLSKLYRKRNSYLNIYRNTYPERGQIIWGKSSESAFISPSLFSSDFLYYSAIASKCVLIITFLTFLCRLIHNNFIKSVVAMIYIG